MSCAAAASCECGYCAHTKTAAQQSANATERANNYYTTRRVYSYSSLLYTTAADC